MNVLPVVGWFFYSASTLTAAQTAARFCSYGLLDTAPTPGVSISYGTWMNLCLTMFP